MDASLFVPNWFLVFLVIILLPHSPSCLFFIYSQSWKKKASEAEGRAESKALLADEAKHETEQLKRKCEKLEADLANTNKVQINLGGTDFKKVEIFCYCYTLFL